MKRISQSGFYLLENAVLLPLAISVLLGTFDLLSVFIAYTQLKQRSWDTIQIMARETLAQSNGSESGNYIWQRYSVQQGALERETITTQSPLPPSTCVASEQTSCTLQFIPTQQTTQQNRSVNTAAYTEKMTQTLQDYGPFTTPVPYCDLANDPGCFSVRINPLEDDSDFILIEATANVPTTFFYYVFAKEFFQIGVQTQQRIEQRLSDTTPLIINDE